MALALSCPCGASFEVEETFAGRNVQCPECQRSIKAPIGTSIPLRTSGYAIASLVMALGLAFTFFGPILAVILGVVALISINRHRSQVTGAGFAVSGIVLGLIFTAVSFFAFSQAELFEPVIDLVQGNQVDRTGPMEIIKEKDGFKITRPSVKWGVANEQMVTRLQPDSKLLLADVARDAYLAVTVEEVGLISVAQCRENIIDSFKHSDPKEGDFGKSKSLRTHGFKLRETHRLPPLGDAAVEEVLLEVRFLEQPITYLIRIIKPPQSTHAYVIEGWAQGRRFPAIQQDFRKGMDSFQLLPRNRPDER